METSRLCQLRTQLRPFGFHSSAPLEYIQHASMFAHKYFVRFFIAGLFGVNISLYVCHVLAHEILFTLMFIFYGTVYKFNQDEEEEKANARLPDGSQRKRKITRVLGVDFAPADTPIDRRVQTLCAALCSFSFIFAGLCFTFLSFYLLTFTRFYWIPLAYSVWYIYDYQSHEQGGRRVHWYRRWRLWQKVAKFFPISLIKTAPLPSDRNYIFGYHPHGIMASGSFINFATDGTNFSELFPGITPHLMTLKMNFNFPFYRELILGLGVVSVTRNSLNWILKRKGTGNAAVIVVGGAQEALDAHRNSDVALTLLSRKGFIKIALQTGSDLVPVFSFGENDLFQQASNPPGSKLRDFQEKMKRTIGFSTPLFHGRGLLQYTWGYVPYRAKITTVVGAPIRVEKTADPTIEQVDALHELYVSALRDLFEQHKHSVGCGQQILTID